MKSLCGCKDTALASKSTADFAFEVVLALLMRV